MCKYTYHHDPSCGHISSFNLDTCTAFTSSLRNTESEKRPITCAKTVHNHDLVHPSNPVLCLQCEWEWMAKREAKGKERAEEDDSEEEESDYEDGPEFLSLEGLTSPMEAWMMVARPKEQEDRRGENRAADEGEGKDKGSLLGLGIATDGQVVADDANIHTTIHDNNNGNDGNKGESPVQSDHTMESPKPFDPEFIVEIAIPKSSVEPDTIATSTPDDTKEYCHIDDSVEILNVEPEGSDNLGSFMDLEESSDEEASEKNTPPLSPRTQELRELEEITGSMVPVIRKCLLKLWNEPPDFRSKTKR